MAIISITKPARIIMGAMVILVVLYTLDLSKILGSALLPPAIKINPSAITITPINIHLKLVFSKNTPIPAGAFVDFGGVAGLAVLVIAMKYS
jgi:hypothetical protein